MSKIAVVYWSETCNTKTMAAKVAEGAKTCNNLFCGDLMDNFDAIAF